MRHAPSLYKPHIQLLSANGKRMLYSGGLTNEEATKMADGMRRLMQKWWPRHHTRTEVWWWDRDYGDVLPSAAVLVHLGKPW